MTDYEKLLSMIRRGWSHSVYEWKGVISSWPTIPYGFELSRVSCLSTVLEYPRGSGRYLSIYEYSPKVELYDDSELCFFEPDGVNPSDLEILKLEPLSFAAWVSQHIGLGRKTPVEISPRLFKLPADGHHVFLGAESSAAGCIAQIQQVINTNGKGCIFITISPYSKISTVEAAAKDIHLFPIDAIIQVNETGVAEKCNLYEIIGNLGRAMTKNAIDLQLPKDAKWEDIRMEISTLDTVDVRNPDMLRDKIRFSFVRNDIVYAQSSPRFVRDLHHRLHSGNAVTALWILMREYARGEGKRDAAKTPAKRDTDNTNRCELAKVLKELIGLTEAPFRQTRPSRTKFTVYFNNF